jgi:hypothetical protein
MDRSNRINNNQSITFILSDFPEFFYLFFFRIPTDDDDDDDESEEYEEIDRDRDRSRMVSWLILFSINEIYYLYHEHELVILNN